MAANIQPQETSNLNHPMKRKHGSSTDNEHLIKTQKKPLKEQGYKNNVANVTCDTDSTTSASITEL